MWSPEDLFFFGDHLISTGKTVRISVKIFFFLRSHRFSDQTAAFSPFILDSTKTENRHIWAGPGPTFGSRRTCNTSINDIDNDIISEEDDPFTINSNTHNVTTNLVKKSLIHNSTSHFNFTAISVNIRSLNNYKNFAKLESLLSALTFKPSIIAVIEICLKPDQLGPHTNLFDYTFLSNPRSKYRGGGVAFYIRVDIEYTHRIDLDIMNEKIFESIFVDIKFQDKSYNLREHISFSL